MYQKTVKIITTISPNITNSSPVPALFTNSVTLDLVISDFAPACAGKTLLWMFSVPFAFIISVIFCVNALFIPYLL